MGASHSGSFMVQSSLAQVNALICDPIFAQQNGLTFVNYVPFPNQVTFNFSSGVTFTSWGEDVQISISSTGPNQVMMMVNSVCSMPTQVVDWGKNAENVNRIANYVLMNIGRYTMAPAQQFCQHCGAQVNGGTFCPKCGQKM